MHDSTQVSDLADTLTDLRTWALRAGSAIALTAVVGAPALASFHGLTHFGTLIGLTGGLEYVVPVTLDGAAAYAALLALRSTLAGESAIWPRVLTVIYALASAAFNAYQAPTSAAAWFYSLAAVSAVVLWDTTLRRVKHHELRTMGYLAGVSAHYRPLRWLLAPGETRDAWRVGVLDDIADPRTALAVVRGETTPTPPDPTLPDGGTPGELPEPTTAPDVLDYIPPALPVGATRWGSKAEALRAAFDAVGRHDVPAAIKWLGERGVTVDRSYAYDVLRRTPPSLRSVAGGGRK